jgi:predicted RNase H-like HicB family nuclease
MSVPRYTMVIQWSDEDGCYVVSLPEWGPYSKTHGDSYEEAARAGQEVLELLLEGEASPPDPKLFHYPGADVVNLPDEAVGPQTVKAVQAKPRRTA